MKPSTIRGNCHGNIHWHMLLWLWILLMGCREEGLPPRFILIFVDLSATASADREYYKEIIGTIPMKLNRTGDRMEVYPITDKTLTDARPLFRSDSFPESKPLENPIVYQKRKSEFQSCLQAGSQAVCKGIDEGCISPYTDLINAFRVAADIFPEGQTQCTLVLLSDMLEDSIIAGKRYNFQRDRVDSKYRSSLLNTLKQHELIPKLKGVSVYVGGARSAEQDQNDERAIEVRKFWEGYINETGADLKAYGQSLYHLLSE